MTENPQSGMQCVEWEALLADALDGLDGDGFIHAERSRLESLRLTAQLGRIDADLRLGGAADVVDELEGLVRSSPDQESTVDSRFARFDGLHAGSLAAAFLPSRLGR